MPTIEYYNSGSNKNTTKVGVSNPLPTTTTGALAGIQQTLLQAATTDYEKLAVAQSSIGFTSWPASGRVTVILTCETADVCWSVKSAATKASHPILRVGDSVTLADVDPADINPKFIALGSTSGEVRATFLKRASA